MPRTITALQLEDGERAACTEAARAAGIDDAVKSLRALLKQAAEPVAALAKKQFVEPDQLLAARTALEVTAQVLATCPEAATSPFAQSVAQARAAVDQGLALCTPDSAQAPGGYPAVGDVYAA